jgi:hypothetical protein
MPLYRWGFIINSIVEMKIYHNFDNPDAEVISDSYKFVYPEEYEEAVVEVQSKMVLPKDVEVDIGCGNAFGGNNEEEGGAGGAGGNEEPVMKVNDLIDGFKYEEFALDKAGFQSYIKDYLKKVLPKIAPARVDKFKKGVTAFVKFVLSKFGDFTIYTPSDYSAEGTLIYSIYKNEEDEAPVFYYIIEGLPSFKV